MKGQGQDIIETSVLHVRNANKTKELLGRYGVERLHGRSTVNTVNDLSYSPAVVSDQIRDCFRTRSV